MVDAVFGGQLRQRQFATSRLHRNLRLEFHGVALPGLYSIPFDSHVGMSLASFPGFRHHHSSLAKDALTFERQFLRLKEEMPMATGRLIRISSRYASWLRRSEKGAPPAPHSCQNAANQW